MLDLENILAKFEEIVSPDFCYSLARRVGLIQRSTSQIQGYEFARSMMIPNAFLEAETLNSLAVRMQNINKTCNLSASALAQRMNTTAALNFMKACFEKMLKETIKDEFVGLPDLQNLSGFYRVLIEDSTMAELHEKLSPYFKGRGGTASKAAFKINYIFDYLSEQIVDIGFFSGNEPDQNLAELVIPLLEKDDLIIRDLGYYALDKIKKIEKKEAYYISRLKCCVDVYKSKESAEPLDLATFLDRIQYQGLVDIRVFVGKERHPVRLVAYEMNEEALNKRRRRVNRADRQRGGRTSKKKYNLLKYSIFITNVPEEVLSSAAVMATYRARWKIELVFKQWKSCLKLHLFKGYKKERFHCLLYGRLIMILLLGLMTPIIMRIAFTLNKELSCYKLTNYLVADHLFSNFLEKGQLQRLIEKLLQDLPRRLCQDKRSRLSMRNNVKLGISYYSEPRTTFIK